MKKEQRSYVAVFRNNLNKQSQAAIFEDVSEESLISAGLTARQASKLLPHETVFIAIVTATEITRFKNGEEIK